MVRHEPDCKTREKRTGQNRMINGINGTRLVFFNPVDGKQERLLSFLMNMNSIHHSLSDITVPTLK